MNLQRWVLVVFALLVSLAPAPGVAQSPGVASWTVAAVEPIEVDGRAVSASPDGTMLAVIGSEGGLCVLEIASRASRCAGEGLGVGEASIAWAPDSSAVAFAMDAYFLFEESDLHVYEIATGQLSNLTDDGIEGALHDVPGTAAQDDMPVWSPDSRQIAFVRSTLGDNGGSTTLMRIDRAGGEPVEILRLPTPEPFGVYTPMAWLADGHLAYTHRTEDGRDDHNGIWRVLAEGGDAELIVPGAEPDEVPHPVIQSVDPGRGRAIVYSDFLMSNPQMENTRPYVWMVDLATGEKTPLGPAGTVGGPVMLPPFVVSADFSPDRERVIAWVISESREYVLTIIDPATGATAALELPDQGEDIPPRQPQWVEGGSVLLLAPGGAGAWLVTLEPAA